ncbi:unnamed protein product [marine sediment metagenome]|uniref:Nucleotidyl transferase AbiEii/AbiGii toxin family protein n=1 Tax=marine sediment metagenome TaxID=412755 RepID=X0WCX2_9ZZZZ
MALLDPVRWEAITPQIHDLLSLIGRQPFAERFYLAGGTALALRLGHRRSVDLDFFSATDEVLRETRQEILHALTSLSPQALEDVDGKLWPGSPICTSASSVTDTHSWSQPIAWRG